MGCLERTGIREAGGWGVVYKEIVLWEANGKGKRSEKEDGEDYD